jgi:hypothetical protein
MGKIVVADEGDVRKIAKDELSNFVNLYLKNELHIIYTKLMNIDVRYNKMENLLKK